METINLDHPENPGKTPVEGDFIRIVYDNGNVEEKHYTPPPPPSDGQV